MASREIRDVTDAPACVLSRASGAPSAGLCEERDRQSEAERDGGFEIETFIEISCRVGAMRRSVFAFCSFAIFDDRLLHCRSSCYMRPRLRRAFIPRILGKICCQKFDQAKLASPRRLRRREARRHSSRAQLACRAASLGESIVGRRRALPLPRPAPPQRVTAWPARSQDRRHAGTPRRIRRAPSRPCRKRRHRRDSRPTSARRGSRRSFRCRLSPPRAPLASSGSSVTATTCSLCR